MYIPARRRKLYGLKHTLKHSPTQFADEVVKNIHININHGLNATIKMCDTLPNKDASIIKIKDATLLYIKNMTAPQQLRYGQGNGIPFSLKALELYMTQEEKNLMVDKLIEARNCFYNYGKKNVADVLADFVEPKTDRVFQVLREFLRLLETETLNKLLSKIDQGADNPEAQKILSKTKKFSFINYDQNDIKTKPEVRRKLIKEIANTTTIAKRLPFILDVSLDDIKAIPPASRLSFLQFAYSPEIYVAKMMSRSTYWFGKFNKNLTSTIFEQRSFMKMENLVVPKLNKEDIEDLLFSVSMAKTDETTKWIEEYSKYLEAANGTLKPKYSY
jgi:hypothetical protein